MTEIDKVSIAARKAQIVLQGNSSAIDIARKSATNSAMQMLKTIEKNSGVRRLLKDVERKNVLMKIAEGPLAELRRAGVFHDSSPLQKVLNRTQGMMAEYEARFRLPEPV